MSNPTTNYLHDRMAECDKRISNAVESICEAKNEKDVLQTLIWNQQSVYEADTCSPWKV